MLKSARYATVLEAMTYTNIKNGHEGPTLPLPQVNCKTMLGSDTGLCHSPRSIRTVKVFLARYTVHDINLPLVQMLMLKSCIHINDPSAEQIVSLTPAVYHCSRG